MLACKNLLRAGRPLDALRRLDACLQASLLTYPHLSSPMQTYADGTLRRVDAWLQASQELRLSAKGSLYLLRGRILQVSHAPRASPCGGVGGWWGGGGVQVWICVYVVECVRLCRR
jgi:hypothetical protein